jgi:thiamine pyrophosphate-dependent acetolactate synthase large subunit-like protein
MRLGVGFRLVRWAYHADPDAARRRGINTVVVRAERAAVHMAHAHAEVTDGLGVAVVTAGHGETNIMDNDTATVRRRVPIFIVVANNAAGQIEVHKMARQWRGGTADSS